MCLETDKKRNKLEQVNEVNSLSDRCEYDYKKKCRKGKKDVPRDWFTESNKGVS